MCISLNVSLMCLHFRVILSFYLLDLKKDLKNCLWHLILNTAYLLVSYLMSIVYSEILIIWHLSGQENCVCFLTHRIMSRDGDSEFTVMWWGLIIVCMPFMLSRLTRPRKHKTKACNYYSEYYTQENDFTIYVWMTSLKQAISSVPSQIVSLNSRYIAYIPILNSLQEPKTIHWAV